nr:MAG TPA: hypothetical protein [Caudoviricetes sp.]
MAKFLEIFQGRNEQMSAKRVFGGIFCVSSIMAAFLHYPFDTVCFLGGSGLSLLGAGLVERKK